MDGHAPDQRPGTSAEAGGAALAPPVAWYLGRDGQQFGPVNDAEFRRLYETGQLRPADLVWREGFAEWRAVASMQPNAQHSMAEVTPPASVQQQPHATSATAASERAEASRSSGPRPSTGAPAQQARPRQPVRPASVAAAPASAPNDEAALARARRRTKPDRTAAMARGGRRIGRSLAWLAIAAFFALTLGAAYFVVAGDKNLLRMATALIPSFGERTVVTAPIGGFAKTADATDAAMQKSLLWQTLKTHHAEWYAQRVKEATAASNAGKSESEIANIMMQAVVALRRQYAGEATSAPVQRLKSIATLFVANLTNLRAHSIDACFQFVSSGEGAPAVVALLQSPEYTSGLQAQLSATFEAIAAGQRTPRIYPRPKPEDYDALVTVLETRGWKDADLQLFSDSGALGKASPESVCRLVTQWIESQLAISEPDTQMRLLVDSLRPVVGG